VGRPRKDSAGAGLTAARVRKLAADARLAELAVLEREGALLPVAEFQEILKRLAAELRARILAMPGKWAPRAVGLRTIGEAQGRLAELAEDLLTALRMVGQELRDATFEPRGAQRMGRRRRGRPRGTRAGT
jgi:hypothetical protein